MATRSSARVRQPRWASLRILPLIITVAVALDLGISNRWMLHPVPTTSLTGPTQIAARISQHREATDMDMSEPLTIDRRDERVDFDWQWFETSSHNRIAEIALWRRESLFPKTHFEIPNVQIIGSFCSIMPSTWESEQTSNATLTHSDSGPKLNWSDQPSRHAWLSDSTDNADLFTQDTSGRCKCRWDKGRLLIHLPPNRGETSSPQRLVFEMPAVPGWTANLIEDQNLSPTPIPINPLDANHGWIAVPQDHDKVELIYRPTEFRVGLALSGISLLVCLTYLIRQFLASKTRKAP